MRLALIVAVVALSFTPQAPGSAQAPAGPRVQITFEPGGLVTLVSNGATLREVLAEWTRLGGSTFVNSERLAQTPLVLQFSHQPEKDVMASLLRPAAGYLLGPRRAGSVGASSFEVVYILPTSNPSLSGTTFGQPQYQQQQISTPGAPDDELPPVGRGAPPPAPGQPAPTPTPTPDYNRPPGVSPVAVPVVPITTTTQPPTQPPPPGRGGASGS